MTAKPKYSKVIPSMKNLPQIKLQPHLKHRVILWFRNDLRMHDNPVLHWALTQSKVEEREIIPVYCFDPRFFDDSVPKFAMNRKTGIHRTQFQVECAEDFRASLQSIGSDLLVSHEKPESFIKKLVKPGVMNTVVYQAEFIAEERHVEDLMKKELQTSGADCQFNAIWGQTLHHIDDLPYDPIDSFSNDYQPFRMKHKDVKVRALLPSPTLDSLPFFDSKKENKVV